MNYDHPTPEDLIDYLHDELPPEADATVLQHVDICESCRAQIETESQLSESLRAYACETARELPRDVTAAIWERIGAERAPSWGTRVAALIRPAVVLPLAAAAALVVYIGYVGTHPPQTLTTIDAVYYLEDHSALTSTIPFGEGTVVPSSLEGGETGSDQHWIASSGASDVAATH